MVLALIIIIPIIFFNISSITTKQRNKEIRKNPNDYRNNPPPPGYSFLSHPFKVLFFSTLIREFQSNIIVTILFLI